MTPEVKEFMESMNWKPANGLWSHDNGEGAITYISDAAATFFYNQFRLRELRARKDEQKSTGTLRYRPDSDGDYGKVYYYIPGKDTVMPQDERISDLNNQIAQLEAQKDKEV